MELLRSRLSCLGPVDIRTLAADFALPAERISRTLTALQAEGYAMAMAAADGADPLDRKWCERRLLARIHRYSRERRRRAVKPVSPSAFMRFLLHWHGLDEPAGELEQALSQLEGWAAPVAAWEQGLLAARCADYSPQRLDELFLGGFLTWTRPGNGAQTQLVSATPVTIMPRSNAKLWFDGATPDEKAAGSVAQRILTVLEQKGAMFASDLTDASGLLPTQLEQGLSELVARGLVTADAFSPLRWLVRPESEKRRKQARLRRGGRAQGVTMLGRWSIAPRHQVESEQTLFADQARLAAVCEALLLRYGVVFRTVIERESLAPPWRYLLRYLRRMEDRGEVNGGRFVDGFSGEQFALPEAVGLLRRQAGEPQERDLTVISAADPLNLGGIITPGVKTPMRMGNRILLLNGVPAARILGEEIEIFDGVEKVSAVEAEQHLRVVRHFPRKSAN